MKTDSSTTPPLIKSQQEQKRDRSSKSPQQTTPMSLSAIDLPNPPQISVESAVPRRRSSPAKLAEGGGGTAKERDRERDRRSAGNYGLPPSTTPTGGPARITSVARKKSPPVVVGGRPTAGGLGARTTTSADKLSASFYYYHPTFREQMKALPCLRVLRASYHKYGLKHAVLILVLLAYSGLGAGIFLLLEQPAEQLRMNKLQTKLTDARRKAVDDIIYKLFNDSSRFLFFISNEQTLEIDEILSEKFKTHEIVVTLENAEHGASNLMRWDFWNAMLYAWTIITTIGLVTYDEKLCIALYSIRVWFILLGYGYLHPTTDKGKIITMIYAIFGIPLFLSVLNDLGKVLTRVMKYPFFLFKKHARRLFQYCSRMSRDQIKEAEARDKARLEVFDLPVPMAIGIVIGWIFVCSAITLTWERDWDYLIAFYFFFISLSTIGFGDVMPRDPRYLLIMFGNIVIGLALVSMCINLIQVKLEKTYTANASPERRGVVVDRSEESVEETSDAGGGGGGQTTTKSQNGGLLRSFFKRASQISLSALSSQSRQASQTSLEKYELTTPPPQPPLMASSDEDVQSHATLTPPRVKKYAATKVSPVMSKKSSRSSPTPSEPLRHVDSDTQTMLSIPSKRGADDRQQPSHVISVSSQRGTVRNLPGTTSFDEIDRIVDINISAELLRNELLDIETYHNILTPQEVIAQIHHESELNPVIEI